MITTRPAAVVALLALCLSGCSEAAEDPAAIESTTASTPPSSTASPSPEASPTPELSDTELAAWIENVFSSNPRQIAAARRKTVPDSDASIYTFWKLQVANSNIDGGYPQEPYTVTGTGKRFEACPPDGETCAQLTDIVQTAAAIDSFRVNGKSLEGRLISGPGRKHLVQGIATIQFLVAYRAVTDDALVVTVRLTAGSSAVSILDANYRGSTGRQTQSANIAGPPDLQARSSATYSLAFPLGKPGGQATLRIYANNGAPVAATVGVPVAE